MNVKTIVLASLLAATSIQAGQAEWSSVVQSNINAIASRTNMLSLMDASCDSVRPENFCLLKTGSVSFVENLISEMARSGVLTNCVKTLAASGEICRLYGHSWRDGRPGEGEGSPYGGFYADYHPGESYRTCRICGKCQTHAERWK